VFGGRTRKPAHPRTHVSGRVATCCLAAALSACAGDAADPAHAGVEVRDSAGVTVVEFEPSTLPVGELVTEPTWSFESIPTGEGDHVLSGVIPLPLDDDRLAIAERSTERVWLGTPGQDDWIWVGGAGDGPAEMRGVVDLELGREGSVWALDATRNRMLRYAADGQLAEAIDVPNPYWSGPNWSPRSGAHYFVGSSRASAATPSGVSRGDVAFVRWEPGATGDTLAFVPGVEWYLFDGGAGGTFLAPYSYAAGSTEGHWIGDNARPSIEFWTGGSAPATVVRWPAVERDMPRLGDSVRTAFFDQVPAEQLTPEIRRNIEGIPVTTAEPQFTDLVQRFDGGVAIGPWWPRGGMPSSRPAGSWMLVDVAGRPVERLALPPGFAPTWFGENHVVGVRTDELGRERVERWEVAR